MGEGSDLALASTVHGEGSCTTYCMFRPCFSLILTAETKVRRRAKKGQKRSILTSFLAQSCMTSTSVDLPPPRASRILDLSTSDFSRSIRAAVVVVGGERERLIASVAERESLQCLEAEDEATRFAFPELQQQQ